MKKMLSLVATLFIAAWMSAQTSTIDSLKHAAQSNIPDTSKVNTLVELSWQLILAGENDSAEKYAETGLQLAQKISFKKGEGASLNRLGVVYYSKGNYAEAIKTHLAALAVREEVGDKIAISGSYNNIGMAYEKQGNYAEALKNYFTSLKIREEIHDKNAIALSYNNIGLVYYEQGKYDEAVKSYLACLKISEETGNKKAIAASYNNLGGIYEAQGNYVEALKSHIAALKLREELGDRQDLPDSYNNIGNVYDKQGNYPEALKNYFACLKISEETGYQAGIASSYNNIGHVYSKQKEFKEAKEFYTKGLSLAKEIGSKDQIMEVYSYMTETAVRMNDYKSAYDYYLLYTAIKDSLFNEESDHQTAQLKEQYESEKKDAQINLLNKDNQLKTQQAQQQRIIKNVFIGGFILSLIIVFLFITRLRLKQRSGRIMEEKNKIITEQKKKVEHQSAMLQQMLDELKQRQQQLVQSEKMASVGVLTAGIAHEMNNPINFLSSNVKPLKRNFSELRKLFTSYDQLLEQSDKKLYAEKLKKDLGFEENMLETENLLQGIEDGAGRTARIVKGLRSFSRMDAEEMKMANINDGIESTLVLLRNKLDEKNIKVEEALGPIPLIECYPAELNQVFMNLFVNAIDAFDSAALKNREKKIWITTSLQNDQVRISIRDNGAGMTDEVKQKIFDPFFTTKDVGKGTGLGLSISYGLIEKHNGTIEASSVVGEGTEFVILLPLRSVHANRN